MPLGGRQADRKLERCVDPLEPDDEGDGQHQHGPLDTGHSEPCRKKQSRDADDELDPRIALRPNDVRDAGERVAERPQEHTRSVRDTGILAVDSVARRINRETFLLLGGTAALLMQVAHPLVAAGVDQHSDFRRSPVRRLVRTVNTTLAIVFGERATAESALKRIGRSHAPVRGQAADGRAYRARDPQLMLWVQATLVLTSVRWYEAVAGRMSDTDRDAYWAEGKFFAGQLGVPEQLFPPTYADLERYEAEMLRTLVIPDRTAAAVARDVVRPYRWLPEPLYWPADALSAALLPIALRDAFGLRFGRRERVFYRAVIVAIRAFRPLSPDWLAVVPQARRFEKAMGERRKAA
jgi:uncharacterized protein (DUF2236 family)